MLNIKNISKEQVFNTCYFSALFFSKPSLSSAESSSSHSSQVQSRVANNTLDSMILPIGILNAEIKWSIKVVQSHFYFRSCIDLNKLFYGMFHDSEIAQPPPSADWGDTVFLVVVLMEIRL